MIARSSILSGYAVLGTDPEEIGPFTDSFITDKAFIWDKMVAIFKGSEAWTHLNPAKNHCDERPGLRLIYNRYLGPRNIDHKRTGVEKNIAKCSYTRKNRNCTFEKYATLHKE